MDDKIEILQNDSKYLISTNIKNGKLHIICQEKGNKNPHKYSSVFSLMDLKRMNPIFEPVKDIHAASLIINELLGTESIVIKNEGKFINIFFPNGNENENPDIQCKIIENKPLYLEPIVQSTVTRGPPSPTKVLPTKVIYTPTREENKLESSISSHKNLKNNNHNFPQVSTSYKSKNINRNIHDLRFNSLNIPRYTELTLSLTPKQINNNGNNIIINNSNPIDINTYKSYSNFPPTPNKLNFNSHPLSLRNPNANFEKRFESKKIQLIPHNEEEMEIQNDNSQMQNIIINSEVQKSQKDNLSNVNNVQIDEILKEKDKQINKLQNDIYIVNNENELIKNQNSQLIDEINKLREENNILNIENQNLKNERKIMNIQQNENQMNEIILLRQKVESLSQELENRKNIELEKYKKIKEEEIAMYKSQIRNLIQKA